MKSEYWGTEMNGTKSKNDKTTNASDDNKTSIEIQNEAQRNPYVVVVLPCPGDYFLGLQSAF